ncbi:hypothetical protein QVD17_07614 [Tagetes erecta]|uniref:Dehydrin n=1 Tax=Tagetes erecta TaxID=13708 RepID=A0AAD8LG57_TARER|nr:hypothetical protein QVD17_07614 [Tagetes erecta]
MADNVVRHHPSTTEERHEEKPEHGLLDCFGKKDENKKCVETDCKDGKNESLLAKLHISDSTSSSSDEECEDKEKKKKKKDKTLKEKVEKKIEEDKVKMNVKIEETREKALELKEKTVEKIEEGKKNVEEFKEKVEEKIKEYEEKKDDEHKRDTSGPFVKYEEVVVVAPQPPASSEAVSPLEPTNEAAEKKGLMEKIKNKLPGGYKKAEDEYAASPPPPQVEAVNADHPVDAENEHKEKKSILEMIKEKLPGFHSKSEEEKKE